MHTIGCHLMPPRVRINSRGGSLSKAIPMSQSACLNEQQATSSAFSCIVCICGGESRIVIQPSNPRVHHAYSLPLFLAAWVFCAAVSSSQTQPSPQRPTKETEPFDIDRFFTNSFVIDGNVNCSSPSGLGQPDFRDVNAKTGIDFGCRSTHHR